MCHNKIPFNPIAPAVLALKSALSSCYSNLSPMTPLNPSMIVSNPAEMFEKRIKFLKEKSEALAFCSHREHDRNMENVLRMIQAYQVQFVDDISKSRSQKVAPNEPLNAAGFRSVSATFAEMRSALSSEWDRVSSLLPPTQQTKLTAFFKDLYIMRSITSLDIVINFSEINSGILTASSAYLGPLTAFDNLIQSLSDVFRGNDYCNNYKKSVNFLNSNSVWQLSKELSTQRTALVEEIQNIKNAIKETQVASKSSTDLNTLLSAWESHRVSIQTLRNSIDDFDMQLTSQAEKVKVNFLSGWEKEPVVLNHQRQVDLVFEILEKCDSDLDKKAMRNLHSASLNRFASNVDAVVTSNKLSADLSINELSTEVHAQIFNVKEKMGDVSDGDCVLAAKALTDPAFSASFKFFSSISNQIDVSGIADTFSKFLLIKKDGITTDFVSAYNTEYQTFLEKCDTTASAKNENIAKLFIEHLEQLPTPNFSRTLVKAGDATLSALTLKYPSLRKVNMDGVAVHAQLERLSSDLVKFAFSKLNEVGEPRDAHLSALKSSISVHMKEVKVAFNDFLEKLEPAEAEDKSADEHHNEDLVLSVARRLQAVTSFDAHCTAPSNFQPPPFTAEFTLNEFQTEIDSFRNIDVTSIKYKPMDFDVVDNSISSFVAALSEKKEQHMKKVEEIRAVTLVVKEALIAPDQSDPHFDAFEKRLTIFKNADEAHLDEIINTFKGIDNFVKYLSTSKAAVFSVLRKVIEKTMFLVQFASAHKELVSDMKQMIQDFESKISNSSLSLEAFAIMNSQLKVILSSMKVISEKVSDCESRFDAMLNDPLSVMENPDQEASAVNSAEIEFLRSSQLIPHVKRVLRVLAPSRTALDFIKESIKIDEQAAIITSESFKPLDRAFAFAKSIEVEKKRIDTSKEQEKNNNNNLWSQTPWWHWMCLGWLAMFVFLCILSIIYFVYSYASKGKGFNADFVVPNAIKKHNDMIAPTVFDEEIDLLMAKQAAGAKKLI
eukprot:GDKK01014980.1.p1 GENE.GDKK01014980.1~~GDKK01014980.1.p1  ORF type:complete len:1002 (+),score=324.79 GDKK01014980.1:79-3084(+)